MAWFFYMLSRVIAKVLFGLFAKTCVLHADRTNSSSPFILAANHISHFDPPILSVAALRKLDWMAMIELFENKWAARYFRAIDTFPADRAKVDRAAVKIALDRLKRGHVVGMFPEGGIRAGKNSVLEGAKLRPGSAVLAEMAGVPIVPCVLLGSDRFYSKAMWKPFRRNSMWIAFGEPLCADPALARTHARSDLEHRLAESLRSLCEELRETYGLTEADLPRTPQHRKGRESLPNDLP
jgi:1-acyl-sn-glycerol-3-phosphate acyltransferase